MSDSEPKSSESSPKKNKVKAYRPDPNVQLGFDMIQAQIDSLREGRLTSQAPQDYLRVEKLEEKIKELEA